MERVRCSQHCPWHHSACWARDVRSAPKRAYLHSIYQGFCRRKRGEHLPRAGGQLVDEKYAARIKKFSISALVYSAAAAAAAASHARERGVIVAHIKFEFALDARQALSCPKPPSKGL